ncbi:hypothetical protein ACFL35_15215 [Candidatus Riflebacteria bacterium]
MSTKELELIFKSNEEAIMQRKHHPLIKSILNNSVVDDAIKIYRKNNPQTHI